MAVTSVILDIKANTDRALNDFKRFSAQLDNKFLISGLKLDVVRNALGQINREFQKAIGEQGLQAGQSLRAAQNQAALLTQTFKGFSSTASLDMAQQFSTAFNEIAVKAGGTAQDIQKALSATPFISTNLSADMRKALGEGVLSFQRDFRRAGLSEDFGNIARQFLMGQLTAGQMIESGDAAQTQIGLQLAKRTGTRDYLGNAQQRSQALLDIVQDPEFSKQLSDMARRASGFRSIIEDLNTRLFNPEKGVFGVLRQVTMSVKDKTTIFDETEKLINSVFGRQGLFVNFFKQIAKIFGLEDPLKLIIIGVRFITKQFDALNKFVQSPEFQNFVTFVKEIFTRTRDFFTGLYNQVTAGTFDKQSIITQIKDIGETVRSYIKRIAATIRGEDISKEADFGTSIIGTLVEEIGKTFVALVAEIGGALLPKAGQIALGLTGALIKALSGIIGAAFSNPLTGTLAAGFLGYKGAKLVGGVRDILDSPGGIGGTANRMLGRPFRPRGAQSLEDRNLASTLGSSQSFHRQVIYYLSRIHACVCAGGFGGGSGIDIDADTPEARRERARTRRGPTGPGMPRRAPLTSLDTINPYAYPQGAFKPQVNYAVAARKAELERRRNLIRGTDSRKYFDLYADVGSMYDPAARLDRVEHELSDDTFNERYDRTRERYRRSTRGGRGLLGYRRPGMMGRIQRAMPRGFGRGALIAGGIGLAGAALFGGGSAQAAEMDPSTGEPRVGAGEAFGRVGMGAAEGALTGAMFGPWGAAIGAAIGGGVALFDKGVRDAIGKSILKFGSDSLKWLDGLRKGFLDNMMRAFDGIKSFTANIDWGNLILDVIFPGRGLARTIAEASGVRPSGQNGGGMMGWLQDRLAEITGRREVGGPGIRGASYLVGERGPEVVTMGQTGTISSNRELMALGSRGYGGSSVSANFNIAINVNGNMGAGDVEALRGPVLAIVEEAWASATQGTVSRGALA